MPRPFSKRLVIDASVARASGGVDATFPASKHCRDFLLAVRENSHRIVFSPALSREWRHHESKFARAWRTAMQQSGRLIHVEDILSQPLRAAIEEADIEKA